MGTDIHTTIVYRKDGIGEAKILKLYNNKGEDITWRFIDHRNYGLFSILAGVRGMMFEDNILVSPRGWPQWEVVGLEKYDDCDYHTKTWYDYCELQAYALTDKALSDYYCESEDDKPINVVRNYLNNIDVLLDAYEIYFPEPGEISILICFDS